MNQITQAKHETPSAFFMMDSTIRKARQLLDRQFEKAGIDLTSDQWLLLDQLQRHKKLSQQELAVLTLKDPGNITRILDILCKKNLALRHTSGTDRRSFEVQLTSRGKRVFLQAKKQALALRQQGFGNLSEREYRGFCSVLEKIYQKLN